MPEIVQEIGAYAGLASVVGLALLSVLYFSQARDVKRLREWAGRAPERAADQEVATQPAPGRATPAQQPQQAPAAKAPAVPAVPAAAGAGAATAKGAAAQPAAANQGAPAKPATPAPAPAGATAAAQPSAAPAGQASSGAAAPTDAPQPASPAALKQAPSKPAPAAGPAAGSGGAAKPSAPPVPGGAGPSPPTRPTPSTGKPAPQATAVIPPPREPWHQRLFGSTRNLILALGGVLLLGAGVALALTQLSGDDDPAPASEQRAQPQQNERNGGGGGNGNGEGRNRPAIDPASVTVAVLNGTTVPGLAAQVSDEVQSAGFEVGTVANSSDQQRAESVILFSPGNEREAAAVSRRLDIAQREPIDAATQGLAGDATVVVVTGADRS